jgi:hypothetical protein
VLCATFGVLILLPVALAPRRWRVEVAYWAASLHPLVFLGWLGIWRFFLAPPPHRFGPGGWYFMVAFEIPYVLASLSLWYIPFLLGIGAVLAADRFLGRPVAVPLIVLMAIWLLTCAVLNGDLFGLRAYMIRY